MLQEILLILLDFIIISKSACRKWCVIVIIKNNFHTNRRQKVDQCIFYLEKCEFKENRFSKFWSRITGFCFTDETLSQISKP